MQQAEKEFTNYLFLGEVNVENILEKISGMVWGWPMMLLFLGVGLLYTLRLRGIQLRYLPYAFGCIGMEENGSGISPYAALCTSLAATIGTGNIVGVATALSAGGPGALLWMLIAAFLGMGTQYAEGFLAAKYRKETGFGGPFAYMEHGLGKKWKWLASLYALIGVSVGLLGVGTVTQVTSITTAVDGFFSSNTAFALGSREISYAVVLSGILITAGAAAVLLGGAKRVTKVCETLVPLMSAAYLIFSGILLLCYWRLIPQAVVLIVKSAFAPKAVLGATAGVTVKTAMRMGIGRGVFTNEAGLGTTAIAAGASNEQDPVRQGLVSMTGTFIDTILICTITGLCLVVTDAWNAPVGNVGITDYAWQKGLPWSESLSSFVLMVCLTFFAFATIIGWNFYAEACLKYLTGERAIAKKIYRYAYLLVVAVAPYMTATAAWEMADILNGIMALPNLTALLLLQKDVIDDTKRWISTQRKKII